MEPIKIRPAMADDWQVIVRANLRLAEETEGKQLNEKNLVQGVRAVLADPQKGRYFVATHREQVVGQVMHTWEWSDWRNGEIWWLQSVYVPPEFRGRGVFRALYDHLFQLAESDETVVGIRLYVENENARAQQTYHKLGMQQPGYHVMETLFDNEHPRQS